MDVKTKATGDSKLNHSPVQGRKTPRSAFPGQVNFALGHIKMQVWWSNQQVKLPSVVLLVIISNQPHNVKRKHVVDKLWTFHAYWAANILVGANENRNVLAHRATGFQYFFSGAGKITLKFPTWHTEKPDVRDNNSTPLSLGEKLYFSKMITEDQKTTSNIPVERYCLGCVLNHHSRHTRCRKLNWEVDAK